MALEFLVTLLCLLLLCDAAAAAATQLLCGATHWLPVVNDSVFFVANCSSLDNGSWLFLRPPSDHDNSLPVVVENVTLMVTHSAFVFLDISLITLVNVSILFSNLTFPFGAPCHNSTHMESSSVVSCLRSVVRIFNASVEGGNITMANIGGQTSVSLVSVEQSTLLHTRVSIQDVQINITSDNASNSFECAVGTYRSVLRDSELVLSRVRFTGMADPQVLQLDETTIVGSSISVTKCDVSASVTRNTTLVLSVFTFRYGNTTRSSWTVEQVSLLVITTTVVHILSFEEVAADSFVVSCSNLSGREASGSVLGIHDSIWTNATAVISAFYFNSTLPTRSVCTIALENSSFTDADVMQLSGVSVIQSDRSGSVDSFCMTDCHAEQSRFVWDDIFSTQQVHHVAGGSSSSSSDVEDFDKNNVVLIRVTLRTVVLLLRRLRCDSPSAALALVSVDAWDTNLTVETSNFTTPRGTMFSASTLNRVRVLFFNSTLLSHTLTFFITETRLNSTEVALHNCTIRAATTYAYTVADSTLHRSRVHLFGCFLHAQSSTFSVTEGTCVAATFTVMRSVLTSVDMFALYVSKVNLTAAQIHVSSSDIRSSAYAFFVFNSTMAGVQTTLSDCNVSATDVSAWDATRTSVVSSVFMFLRSAFTANAFTFQVTSSAFQDVNTSFRNSVVSAASSYAVEVSDSNWTLCTLEVEAASFLAQSHAFALSRTAQRSTFNSTNMTFRGCVIDAGVSFAWIALDVELFDCVVELHRCSLLARSFAMNFQRVSLSTTAIMMAAHTSITARAGDFALSIVSCGCAASTVSLSDCSVAARSDTFALESCTFVSTRLSLLQCNVRASRSYAWHAQLMRMADSEIAVYSSGVSAQSQTFGFSSSTFDASNITLVGTDVTASDSYAWSLIACMLVRSTMLLQDAWLSADASDAFRIGVSNITTFTNISILSCVLFASAFAWIAMDSVFAGGSVTVQDSILEGDANAFIVANGVIKQTRFCIAASDLYVAESAAVFFFRAHVFESVVMFEHCSITGDSEVVSLSGTYTLSTVAFIDCSVVAEADDALGVVLADMYASVLSFLRTRVTSANYALLFYVVTESFTRIELVDCRVVSDGAHALSMSQASLNVSTVTLQSCEFAAAVNTMSVNDATVVSSELFMDNCSVSTLSEGTDALSISRVSLDASTVTLQSCELAAAAYAMLLDMVTVVSSKLLMTNCTVSSAKSEAWAVYTTNVTASNIALDSCRILTHNSTVFFGATNLTTVKLTVVNCTIIANGHGAWIFLASTLTNSTITFVGTHLLAETYALFVSDAIFCSTQLSLTGCDVRIASGFGILFDSVFAMLGSTVSVKQSDVRRTTTALVTTIGDPDVEHFALLSFWDDVFDGVVLLIQDSLLHDPMQTPCWDFTDSVLTACSIVVDSTQSLGNGSAGVLMSGTNATSLELRIVRSSAVSNNWLVCESDSNINVRYLLLALATFSCVHNDREGPGGSVVAFLGAVLLLDNITIDACRFAGYSFLLGVNRSAASSALIQVEAMTARCSWWSHTIRGADKSGLRWRPLTKLCIGEAIFLQLPTFAAVSVVDPSAQCGDFTSSASVSTTLSNPSASSTPSACISASRSDVVTATSVLTATISTTLSKQQLSISSSVPLTHTEAVPLRIVKRRSAEGLDGVAAALGVAVSATSFAAAWSGLTAQRLAFVVRSAGTNCPSIQTESSSAAVDDRASEPVDWLSSPTMMSIGSDTGAAHRGAVVGNLVVCASTLVGVAIAVCVLMAISARSVDELLLRFHVRHIVSVPMVILLQPTFMSAVMLLQVSIRGTSPPTVLNAGTGTLGIFIVVAFVGATAYMLDPRSGTFRAIVEAVRLPKEGALSSGIASAAAVTRWWGVGSAVVWRPRAAHPKFVLEWGFLFDELNAQRHWWPVVDLALSLVMAGLDCAVPSSSDGCVAWKWIVVGVTLLSLASPVLLRPFALRRAMYSRQVMASLVALIATLSALEVDSAAIETVGILAAVLEWLPFVLQLVFVRCCGLTHSPQTNLYECITDPVIDAAVSRTAPPPQLELLNVPEVAYLRRPHRSQTETALKALITMACSQSIRQQMVECQPK